MFDKLPNDILHIIYKKKHELELKDVHNQLLYKYKCKVNSIYNYIKLFKTTVNYCLFILTNFSASDIYPLYNIFALYGALKNEGIIDQYELLSEIIEFRKLLGLTEEHETRFINDAKSIIFDETISINIVLNECKFIFQLKA